VTLTRSQVSGLLRDHGLSPSRALGQNFLVDPNTARRIVRLAEVRAGDRVVEIGPGLGSLTLALLDAGAEVVAVELDRRLAAVLADVVQGRCRIVVDDALTTDLDALAGPSTRVVANLPYNVAVPVVMRILEEAPWVDAMLVMVQAEVAERIAASAGDDAYGAVSVKVAYYATARIVGRVPPTVFLPQPKVDSALVAVSRRSQVAVDPAVVAEARLFEVVRTAFAQRRKMLRRSLDGVVAPEAFEAAGVAPTQRPEELSVEAFGRLARLP
jgi:16S rRNA (adenine1518-N6/adenine1519-N6)-dimethyltransferase